MTLAILCAAVAACANGAPAIPKAVRLSGTGSAAAVTLLSSSADGVTLRCGLGALDLTAVAAATMQGGGGEDFVLLSLPEQTYTGEVGKPKLPMLSAVLDVPQGATIELAVEPGEERTVVLSELGIAQRIAPALAPVPKREGARPQFALDDAVYRSDFYYPAKLAEIDDIASYAGLARGHRLAAVRFHPIQYDPAAGMIRYYPQLTARVTFRHGDRARTAALVARDYSRDWEGFIRRLVVNGGAAADSLLPLPVYYDIIYGGTYANAARRLAAWKRRCGFSIRSWNATGWTAQAIRDSIRAQTPRATYLLIISDPDGSDPLPPSALGTSTGMATDLYYAETNGIGYLPDLFNARLSVKTAAEANIAVDKLIKYEQADFGAAGTAWLKKALLIAGYDGSYQTVGMATNAYCKAILEDHGYAVDTLVIAPGENPDRIASRINDGRVWAVYTAHGSVQSWAIGQSSNFTVAQLLDSGYIHNAGGFTLPMGHCCYSGDFNSGAKAPGSFDCFGETWPKLAGRGGVSYFGSVPSSYWDEDDWLQRRYFDAIYDSVPGTPGLQLTEIGRFTRYGQFWIEANTATTMKRYYFEAYHVFNDPAMDFWTGVPRQLTVSHAAVINGAGALSVSVRDQSSSAPLANALVCAASQAQPGIRAVAYTDAAGQAALPLGFTTGGDTVWVTATKHDYAPHLGFARMAFPLAVRIAPAVIDINVPTAVNLTVTDPQAGNAPAESVSVCLARRNGDTTVLGVTGPAGTLGFTVCAGDRYSLVLYGRKPGNSSDLFMDSIRVSAPAAFVLLPNAPNPFSGATAIRYNLPRDAMVDISLYNLLGQKIRTLVAGSVRAGYHSIAWNGTNEQGVRLASGIYFCRFSTTWSTQIQRMVLIR